MNIKKILESAFEQFKINKIDDAILLLNKILKKYPNHKDALSNYGLIQIKKGDKVEGRRYLERSLAVEFNDQVAYNLVLVLLEMQLWDEADEYNKKLLNKDKQNIKYKYNQAFILRGLRRYDEAIDVYREIISHDPMLIDAYVGKGFVFNILKNYDEAIAIYRKALELDSNYYPAIYNMGIALNNNQDASDAIPYLERACKINPNNIDGWLTLAAAKIKMNEIEDATRIINISAEIDNKLNPSGSIAAIFQQALLEMAQDKWTEAIEYFKKVLILDPNHIETKYHMGMCYLSMGEYLIAHDYYKYRSHREKDNGRYGKYNDIDLPVLDKKTELIVAAEQGLGDQIVVFRLLPYLAKKVNKLVYVSYDKLESFITSNFNEFEVISQAELIESEKIKFKDYIKMNLLSIFHYLPDTNHLKNKLKILNADNFKINKYQKKYKNNKKKLIGLSWKSQNEKIGKRKSMKLIDFMNLLKSNAKNNFINLQYGDVQDEINEINLIENCFLMNDDQLDYYNDLDSLAALIYNCDLVITVSNLTAHIAGSLGVKTILLLPKHHGKFWYWNEKTTKSSWYPSVEIIMQKIDNDWNSVIEELNQKIKIDKYLNN